jgi:formate-dependent nitrite reductase membrane component NrfD
VSLERTPYGRHSTDNLPVTARDRQLGLPPYQGQTYYGQPVLKSSYYGPLVASYFFVGGLAGAAQVIASIADVTGPATNRTLVRSGRYLATAGALAGTGLLIADLHTPRRWYMMLRIFRRTSSMSIGAWTLATFGTLSGLTAAAQAVADLTDAAWARRAARMLGLPAAAAGEIMTTYTGALLATTSTPLWAAGDRLLPALFATSALSTATAALLIVVHRRGGTPAQAIPLERVALLTGVVESLLARALERRWQRRSLTGPLQHPLPAIAYRVGFREMGLLVPLTIHGISLLTRRRSRRWSLLAAITTLAGGYLLRSVIVAAGNASTRSPQDYFRFTQPPEHTRPQAQPSLASLSPLNQEAIRKLDRALQVPAQRAGGEVDEAETLLVRLRDSLIHELRAQGSTPAAAQQRTALTRLNTALSLLVGVEYPAAGIQRSAIEQARDILNQILAEGLLT